MSDARHDPVKIGIVSISDRASRGVYEDKGLPALRDWLLPMLMNGQVRVGCSESAGSRQKGGPT